MAAQENTVLAIGTRNRLIESYKEQQYKTKNLLMTTIHFKRTLSDHIHACRVYQAKTRTAKLDKVISVFCFVMGCLTIYNYGIRWWTLGFFPLALVHWFDIVTPLRVWMSIKRNIKLYTGEYELIFDHEGVHAKSGVLGGYVSWEGYNTVLESDKVFLLVYGRWFYTIVPKRVFADEKEMGVFREMLKGKIKKIS